MMAETVEHLEAALSLMAEAFSLCDFCPIANTSECSYTEKVKYEKCNNSIINHFKEQANANRRAE